MRVRVRFRYRTDTGEVETFVVEDLHDGRPLPDHDARHDAAALAVGRVIDANPVMSEVVGETAPEPADAIHLPGSEEAPTARGEVHRS
ncbi:hypothetical protein ACFO1B_40130 [Dactylosporangium siamense]|uniref:FtsH ternary system domain-containing protein n=1 Tax=Dactylosporangium siamense TaxID=685454 RepID=A0A919PWP8_9ACTN|nr:hypothetical protein [Dactylosporangium siamense]GIG50003.1 hypothetical protein Dsi01nite_080440 [Dactylosporangium siamense]